MKKERKEQKMKMFDDLENQVNITETLTEIYVEYNCPRCRDNVVYAQSGAEIMCSRCMCELEEDT
mgnify:CR=1 FL=1